jgi:hypothetical protein
MALAQGAAPVPAAPRTGLYTEVMKGNVAADNTVDIFSRRPTLIGDRQYFAGFGSADLADAAFSIKGMGWNWFGEITGPLNAGPGGVPAGVPNTLRLGLGSGSAWGGGLLLAVDRTHVKAGGTETTTYFEPSGIGAFFDLGLGHSDVYGEAGWNTGVPNARMNGVPFFPAAGTPFFPAAHNSVEFKPAGGSSTENNYHQLSLMAGWKRDAAGEGTHAIDIEGSYVFGMHSTSGITPSIDDKVNILSIMPMWGYVLRANADYSVFIGANSGLGYEHDDVGGVKGNQFFLFLSPNIGFQKQLGHGFEGFSGFSVKGILAASNDEPASNDEASTLLTGGADVAVGLRWVKDNLAFEGSLKEAVLANGPYLIGGNSDQGLFGNIGLSLGF